MDVPGSSGSLSIEVGTNHGAIVVGDHNVVNVQVAAPRITLRTPAAVHRPRTPEGFLDRRDETGAVRAALGTHRVVSVEGESRIGKSWFLQQAADQAAAQFADGALYLPPGMQGPRDVLQSLFEMFYDADLPAAPSTTRLRELLAERQALVVVDDSALSAKDTEAVLDAARGCRLLIASAEAMVASGATGIRLGGLPLDDALTLAERVHGGAMNDAVRDLLRQRCREVEGHPQRVIDAAALLRTAASPATLGEGQALVAAVRAFAPHPVPRDCLPELAEIADPGPALAALVAQGVLEVDRDEVRLGPRAEVASGDAPSGVDALVRLGQAARAEPSRRRRALKALPLLWLVLGKSVSAQSHADVLALAQAWHVPVTLAGLWDGWSTLLGRALDAARRLGDAGAQAWALHQSGTRELALGQAGEAATLFRAALQIEQQLGHTVLEAATRYHLDLIDKLGLLAAAGGGTALWWAAGGGAKLAIGGAAIGLAAAGWIGSAPSFEVAPRALTFRADATAVPPPQELVIRNGGLRALPPAVVAITGTGAGRFVADADCAGRELQRGQSCRVVVRYTPADGAAEATLSLRAGDHSVSVPLAGQLRQARLVLPERLDFGEAAVGAPAVIRRVELRNAGDGPVGLVGFMPPPPPFTLSDDACRGATLAPGQACEATLRFAPFAAGPVEARLELAAAPASGAASSVVRLEGSGRADGVVAEPAMLDFGSQPIGAAALPRSVRLTNHGESPVRLGVPRVSPSFAPFLAGPGSCRDATLAPGEGCDMTLAFTPRQGQAGEHRASVRIGASAGAPVVLAASGVAVAARAEIDPPVVDFGGQPWPPAAGAPRPRRTVTLTNRGAAPLRAAWRIGGASVADFPYRENCPPELAPGSRCTVVVDYLPHAAGASDAYLTLDAPGAEGTLRLPLLGRAVASAAAVPVLNRPGTSEYCTSSTKRVDFQWSAPADMIPGPVQYRLVLEPGGSFDVGGNTRHVVELACPSAYRWRVEANPVNQAPGVSPWRRLSTFRSGSVVGPATRASG